MADEPPREYVPSPKHKWPKGFGELCPLGLVTADAQEMLDVAISVPRVRQKAVWVAHGQWLFMAYPAHPNDPERNEWHGFPVVGSKADPRVLYALQHSGVIDQSQFMKLKKQKRLPLEWPA